MERISKGINYKRRRLIYVTGIMLLDSFIFLFGIVAMLMSGAAAMVIGISAILLPVVISAACMLYSSAEEAATIATLESTVFALPTIVFLISNGAGCPFPVSLFITVIVFGGAVYTMFNNAIDFIERGE